MATVTVRQALKEVADNPEFSTDVLLDVKVHELVSRTLFEIANAPNVRIRGSMARATRAQRMIMNRLVGLRRAGSHPAARKGNDIEFVDLTIGVLE